MSATIAPREVDVVVYGGTPGGIAAALAAAEQGRSVLLIEPYRHIGGLTTNGLSQTDFVSYMGLTGKFRDFADRVHAYYVKQYGADSQQAKLSCFGVNGEPSVNRRIFEEMLAEQPQITLVTRHRLQQVEVEKNGELATIRSATFTGPDGETFTAIGKIFIDATYEGDLIATAGVSYTVGREGRAQYNESLAPAAPDGQVQAYNFRLCMTNDPERRVLPSAPEGYDRREFLPLLDLLGTEKLSSVFCGNTGGIYKAHPPGLPHGKYDINDVSQGAVRLSLPEIALRWPEADFATREKLRAELLLHNVGMLHFLQNDEAVPAQFRDEAREWGLVKDEFVDTDHIPEQVYVREARRMIGLHVYTQQDAEKAGDDHRAKLHRDSVALGDYMLNCHGAHHEGPRIGGRHTGEFYRGTPPYQIPYGVIAPREASNLLAPVAMSASHVGFCALRLEPVWMALGQAAGVAACAAIDNDQPVQRVEPQRLQTLLHAAGAATVYVSDVPRESPDFAAVQWWGTLGGLHGLPPSPAPPGPRVRNRNYATANHAAGLQEPLTEELRARWLELAKEQDIAADVLQDAGTRGEFVRRAYAAAHAHEEPILKQREP